MGPSRPAGFQPRAGIFFIRMERHHDTENAREADRNYLCADHRERVMSAPSPLIQITPVARLCALAVCGYLLGYLIGYMLWGGA